MEPVYVSDGVRPTSSRQQPHRPRAPRLDLARDALGTSFSPRATTVRCARSISPRPARRSRSSGADSRRSGGTINRIGALAVAPGRVYVAAGDVGLVTYNTAAFSEPYALRSYSSGSLTFGVLHRHARLRQPRPGGIAEYTQMPALADVRAAVGRACRRCTTPSNGFLLDVERPARFFWTLRRRRRRSSPRPLFSKTITSAVLIGATAYSCSTTARFGPPTSRWWRRRGCDPDGHRQAVLHRRLGHSIRSLICATTAPPPSLLPTPSFASPQRTVNVDGAATRPCLHRHEPGRLDVPGDHDRGLARAAEHPPNSRPCHRARAHLPGGTLLELTDDALLVWNVPLRTLTRKVRAPAAGVALHATADPRSRMSSRATHRQHLVHATFRQLPALVGSTTGNAYYKARWQQLSRLIYGTDAAFRRLLDRQRPRRTT